jgi:hypothetical protein
MCVGTEKIKNSSPEMCAYIALQCILYTTSLHFKFSSPRTGMNAKDTQDDDAQFQCKTSSAEAASAAK